MSFEQKYLKYKQKYQELKKLVGEGNVNKLETETYNDVSEFNLTDTPTAFELPKQSGGAETEEVEFNLSDTPIETQEEQKGGAPLVPFDYTPSAPLTSCAGQVNPMPDVNVPMTGGADLMPADYTPPVPLSSCAGQVNPQPNVNVPGVVTQNKNLVNNEEELNTTTDLSEIQNTEDIAKLFNQLGGNHKHGHSSSSSSSTDTSDSEISTSDSF
jgi:hypothetical protein